MNHNVRDGLAIVHHCKEIDGAWSRLCSIQQAEWGFIFASFLTLIYSHWEKAIDIMKSSIANSSSCQESEDLPNKDGMKIVKPPDQCSRPYQVPYWLLMKRPNRKTFINIGMQRSRNSHLGLLIYLKMLFVLVYSVLDFCQTVSIELHYGWLCVPITYGLSKNYFSLT